MVCGLLSTSARPYDKPLTCCFRTKRARLNRVSGAANACYATAVTANRTQYGYDDEQPADDAGRQAEPPENTYEHSEYEKPLDKPFHEGPSHAKQIENNTNERKECNRDEPLPHRLLARRTQTKSNLSQLSLREYSRSGGTSNPG